MNYIIQLCIFFFEMLMHNWCQ